MDFVLLIQNVARKTLAYLVQLFYKKRDCAAREKFELFKFQHIIVPGELVNNRNPVEADFRDWEQFLKEREDKICKSRLERTVPGIQRLRIKERNTVVLADVNDIISSLNMNSIIKSKTSIFKQLKNVLKGKHKDPLYWTTCKFPFYSITREVGYAHGYPPSIGGVKYGEAFILVAFNQRSLALTHFKSCSNL